MFTEHSRIDRKQIDQMLEARIQALGLDAETLAQPVGGAPLREVLGDLIEQTLAEADARSRQELIERQRVGREAAAKAGVALGRPSKQPNERRMAKMRGLYESGAISAEEAARRMHVSVSTFYRWLRMARSAGRADEQDACADR